MEDCLPPTNKEHWGEWSVSRGSTQAKCYDCLGKYVIRQTGINTITSLLVRNTDLYHFQTHSCCLVETKMKVKSVAGQGQYLKERWSDTDMK